MDESLRIVVAAGVCLLIYLLVRRRWNLRIVVRKEVVDVQGRALAAKAVQVRNFFREEFAEVDRAKVEGFWDGRYLRLSFRGKLSPGQRQRIRNYLLQIL